MFYIKELCLRFYYIVFSFFIVLGVLWLYKKNLLTVLTFSLLNTLVANNEIFFEHLIYTNPAEVFYIYFSLCLQDFLVAHPGKSYFLILHFLFIK